MTGRGETGRGIGDPAVAAVFSGYPAGVRDKLLSLRELILETAAQTPEAGTVEEALRWGEPSYLAEHGSTLRIGWKKAQPGRYAMFFHCQTLLVPTFREIFGDRFRFEGKRAIVFDEGDEVPVEALRQCVAVALTYRRRRHLPLLGL